MGMVSGMAMIALGADHAGFPLKQALKSWLAARGHLVFDLGTHSTESVDYPDYAAAVARMVCAGRAERGLLVCGSGIGMAIAANKIPGIRAAVAGDAATAQLSREHNDTNVLALGARVTGAGEAALIVQAWLDTPFAGGRHARRVDKLADLDGSLKAKAADAATR
jgi:ribose 5-phosphate isomerase B